MSVRRVGYGAELGMFDLAIMLTSQSVLISPYFWHLLGLHVHVSDGSRQTFLFHLGTGFPLVIFSKFAQALIFVAQAFKAEPFLKLHGRLSDFPGCWFGAMCLPMTCTVWMQHVS